MGYVMYLMRTPDRGEYIRNVTLSILASRALHKQSYSIFNVIIVASSPGYLEILC